jgi:hypothetical protein
MRTLLAVSLVAACSRSAEPPPPAPAPKPTPVPKPTPPPTRARGAFDPDRVVTTTTDETRIAVNREAVPLEEMPMGRWLAGLPMRGLANVKIDLAAPVQRDRTLFSQAHGTFAFTCDHDCRIGDDIAPLELARSPVDVGHVDIDKLALHGTVENGHAKLTQLDLVSPDMKLAVDLDIALADDLAASTIEGCIRFAPAADLAKRRPKTWSILQLTGASLDQTGMFSIRITGTLGAPKRLAEECGPSSQLGLL